MNAVILAAESNTAATALIAAAGVVIGALVTAIAAAYSARMKTRELVLTYQQKLQDNYLENARAYTKSIYVPLSIAIYELTRSYESFRTTIDFESGNASADAKEAFEKDVLSFTNQFDLLIERGAAAFLTTGLEQRLADFTAFLKTSLNAGSVAQQTVLTVSDTKIEYAFAERSGIMRVMSIIVKLGLAAASVGTASALTTLGIPGFNFETETQILAAPLTSRDFEQRIIKDTATINYLIKEVTLGTHGTHASP